MHSSGDIEFILLSATKVGDKQIVLHTFSRELGRKSFITSIDRSSKMTLFQTLNILSGKIMENNRSKLSRASSIRTEYPLMGIRGNIHKAAISMFIGEVLYKSIRDGVVDPVLYDQCKQSIITLDNLDRNFASFHLWFLLELCAALGFRADIQSIRPFAGDKTDILESLLQADFPNFLLYPLTGRERSEIARIIIDYLSYHSETKLAIRSLQVLQELYA